jgi:hypothetical protein
MSTDLNFQGDKFFIKNKGKFFKNIFKLIKYRFSELEKR